MHGPKVSPDFLADAGENIDWSEFQQSAPRVGRVCDFFFFLTFFLKSIFYLFSPACCNQFANISLVSGNAAHRSDEGTKAPNSAKKINLYFLFCFSTLLSDVLTLRQKFFLVSIARE